ncbi:MAG: WbqC family protein [Bacteroidales bacterium]|nr:WbqC family protein [Bacteroidales bacterium]MDD4821183.1 WbqC family protein [Bacteroidales bacterium]
MKATCLTSNYLAPVQYYSKLISDTPVYIEINENYIKQSYRNRCVIAGANGPLTLSIPVVKPTTPNSPTKDIRISDHGNWRHLHWNAIISAYNSTPFFEYYQDDFAPFYTKKYTFLLDMNEQLRELICTLIDIQPDIHYTSEYLTPDKIDFEDYREMIQPGKDSITDPAFNSPFYYQVFTSRYGFLPNLSIIDILFNMGPESKLVLMQSIKTSVL